MLPKGILERKYEGVGILEGYEKSAYIKNDDQSSGSTAENVCDRKKRNRAKKRAHKQQQDICKPSNLNGWLRYLMGCMLMSIGMLVLCWMALVTFEAWTEPATSNLILRSFGTKLGVFYKILLGQRIWRWKIWWEMLAYEGFCPALLPFSCVLWWNHPMESCSIL